MVRNASLRRLYVDHPLSPAQRVPLSRDQAHYLFNVMRMAVGDDVVLFNGADGEWQARVIDAGKKAGVLECTTQTRQQSMPSDLWLLCAPIRKERMAFVQKLKPLLSNWNTERMILHCDEDMANSNNQTGLSNFQRPPGPWAILVGPEGGFSPAEKSHLSTSLENTIVPIGLGPRILRAETAAVAALTLWQVTLGDWA